MTVRNQVLLLLWALTAIQCGRDESRSVSVTMKEEMSIFALIGIVSDFDSEFFSNLPKNKPVEITKEFENELRWLRAKQYSLLPNEWFFDGDGWGHSYKVIAEMKENGTTEIVVSSSGADGKWSTGDDISRKESFRLFKDKQEKAGSR